MVLEVPEVLLGILQVLLGILQDLRKAHPTRTTKTTAYVDNYAYHDYSVF